jgi:hypothetical protein
MKLRKQGVERERPPEAAQAQQLSREPEVRKAVYKGNARYALEIAGQRKPGEGLRLLDMFTVQTDRNGVMTIAAKPLKDKERDFAQLGITMNGSLSQPARQCRGSRKTPAHAHAGHGRIQLENRQPERTTRDQAALQAVKAVAVLGLGISGEDACTISRVCPPRPS